MCVYQGMCTAFNNYRLNNLEKLFAFHYNCNIDLSESIITLINELESDDDKKIILQILSIYNNPISLKAISLNGISLKTISLNES